MTIKRRTVIIGAGAAALAAAGFGVWGRREWYGKRYAQPRFNTDQPLSYAVESPDGRLRTEILFAAAGGGAPRWKVQQRGGAVMEQGALELILSDGRKLGPGVQVIGQQLARLDETGACNELAVQMLDAATGIIFDFRVRTFDTGVASQYLIRYVPDDATVQLAGESTTITAPFATPWRSVVHQP